MANPQKYRDEAAKLRRDAETVQSSIVKNQMLEIAYKYVRLAERASRH